MDSNEPKSKLLKLHLWILQYYFFFFFLETQTHMHLKWNAIHLFLYRFHLYWQKKINFCFRIFWTSLLLHVNDDDDGSYFLCCKLLYWSVSNVWVCTGHTCIKKKEERWACKTRTRIWKGLHSRMWCVRTNVNALRIPYEIVLLHQSLLFQ